MWFVYVNVSVMRKKTLYRFTEKQLENTMYFYWNEICIKYRYIHLYFIKHNVRLNFIHGHFSYFIYHFLHTYNIFKEYLANGYKRKIKL